MVVATAAWSFALLAGSTESFAWIRWVVVALAVPAVAGLLVGAGRLWSHRRAAASRRRLLGHALGHVATVGVVAALLTGLAGTSAYAVATASVAHTGSIPSVGSSSSMMGGPSGASSGERPAFRDGSVASGTDARPDRRATRRRHGRRHGREHERRAHRPAEGHRQHLVRGRLVVAVGGVDGAGERDRGHVDRRLERVGRGGDVGPVPGGRRAGPDHLLHRRWPGRWSGRPGDSDNTSRQIAAWVAANYTATTVGGQTVYDLTA